MSDHDVPEVSGMPVLGLGTWQNDDPEQCAESVRTALDAGYRHVDTAQIYRNEAAVGSGLARSSVPREDVFLATKVWVDSLAREDVFEAARASLDRLGVDAVDLLYVHWPARTYDPEETLPAFAELRDRGRIDRIGVSNFEPADLDRARGVLGEDPFANQVECHPFLDRAALRAHMDGFDTELVAYSPLARGEVFGNETLRAVAEKHGADEAQVSLAWLRETGAAAVPKATGGAHIRDNLASLELDLDREDVARIDAIERTHRLVDPRWAPWR